MMHICHMSTVHRSDDVRIFQKQCRSQVENNLKVTFVVPDDNDKIEDGVEIVAIRRDMSKLSRIFIQPLRVLLKVLNIRADVYQFHDYELWSVGLILRLLGKKVVADVHEDVPGQLLQRSWVPSYLKVPLSFLVRGLEITFARFMSGVITADEVLAGKFIPLNKHVIAIQNYPILVKLPKRNARQGFIVKSLGGVFDERCAETIINTASYLPSVIFEIGGGISSLYESCDWQNENCSYLGRLSHNEIYQQYADADVLIVMFSDAPNHQDIKSNRLFESMYAGKPVIVSNLPKWKEFVEHHQCGLAINPNSPNELVEAIQYIMNNPIKSSDMGKKGQFAVMNEFSWDSQVKNLIEFYGKI